MKWVAVSIGLLGVLLTVKPFIRSANWFIRLGDFPRLQILGLLLLAIFLYSPFFVVDDVWGYLFFLILSPCVFYQVQCVLPFTFLSRKEVQDAREAAHDDTNISVLIFNVLMENRSFGQVYELIKREDADVVLLAEPNKEWAERLDSLNEIYPHRVLHLLENHYGMMLFSKLELSETDIDFIIQKDVPSIHTKIKLRSGDEVAFHGLHPRPPVPEEHGRSTERDGELLLVGKAVRLSNLPVIVAGDMNDAAWSYTNRLFKRISGLLDPRVGRGFYNTFHAKYPFFRLPLDHIFHSYHFRVAELRRIKDACGSDHFPVFAKLSFEKDALREQSRPIAHLEETEEAHEIVSGAMRLNRFKRISMKRLKERIAYLKNKISRRK